MIAAVRPSRRHARLLALWAAHACRHHYGSLITFAVLAAALSFALTSSSFSARSAPESVKPPAASIVLPLPSSIAAPPVPIRRVTYYLYETEEQRKLYQDIVRTDYSRMTWMGLPDYIGEVQFLRVASEAEEAYASYLVSEVVAWAKVGGVTVHVVDLR